MNEKAGRFQIAILLYPGVTALDAVGPWEVLSRMPNTDVRLVGKEVGPVMAEGGALLLGVSHTVSETPSPDLVLVPGGTTTYLTGYARYTKRPPGPPRSAPAH
jgi:putative intracellular protease/amidase